MHIWIKSKRCSEFELTVDIDPSGPAPRVPVLSPGDVGSAGVVYESAVTWHATTYETSDGAYRTDGGGSAGVDYLTHGLPTAKEGKEKSAWLRISEGGVSLQPIVKGVLKGEALRWPTTTIVRITRADPPKEEEMRPVRMRKPNGKLANTIRETYPRAFFAIVARSDAKRGLRRDVFEAVLPDEEAVAALARPSTASVRAFGGSGVGSQGLPLALNSETDSESTAVVAFCSSLDQKVG